MVKANSQRVIELRLRRKIHGWELKKDVTIPEHLVEFFKLRYHKTKHQAKQSPVVLDQTKTLQLDDFAKFPSTKTDTHHIVGYMQIESP
jgi:hypothetical protein